MLKWICADCTDECENKDHTWVQAELIQREDGSKAWLVSPGEEPDVQED